MQKKTGIRGIVAGTLFVVAAGIVYIILLHEPGPAFYPFAALVFLGGPLIAGAAAVAGSREQSCRACLIPGVTVFAIAFMLFFITYAVLPQFDRTSVELPESCNGFDTRHPPAPVPSFLLPGTGTGLLVAGSEETAVVAMIDDTRAPYPSTVWIINRSDNRTLWRGDFADDTIAAAVDSGIVYLYNDKVGYVIDARTGAAVQKFLLIDNYGGLSDTGRPVLAGTSGKRRYLETTAVISLWSTDGTVRPRSRLTMNGIAYNCYVNGTNREIVAI